MKTNPPYPPCQGSKPTEEGGFARRCVSRQWLMQTLVHHSRLTPDKGLLKKPVSGSAARRLMRRRRDGFVGTGLRACPDEGQPRRAGQARRPVPTANNLEGRTGLFQQPRQGGGREVPLSPDKRDFFNSPPSVAFDPPGACLNGDFREILPPQADFPVLERGAA